MLALACAAPADCAAGARLAERVDGTRAEGTGAGRRMAEEGMGAEGQQREGERVVAEVSDQLSDD